MSLSEHYDRQGNPIDFMQWGKLFEDKEYQGVAKDYIGNVHISTVWLGIDHGWGNLGPPLIFETMIFNCPEYEDYQVRYSTEEAALAGHAEAVALVREVTFGMAEDEEDLPDED